MNNFYKKLIYKLNKQKIKYLILLNIEEKQLFHFVMHIKMLLINILMIFKILNMKIK